MFGLSPKEIAYIRLKVVAPLEKAGLKVFVFGSRARGEHKKYSDLDLLVEGNAQECRVLIAEIRDVLENEKIPLYGRSRP